MAATKEPFRMASFMEGLGLAQTAQLPDCYTSPLRVVGFQDLNFFAHWRILLVLNVVHIAVHIQIVGSPHLGLQPLDLLFQRPSLSLKGEYL